MQRPCRRNLPAAVTFPKTQLPLWELRMTRRRPHTLSHQANRKGSQRREQGGAGTCVRLETLAGEQEATRILSLSVRSAGAFVTAVHSTTGGNMSVVAVWLRLGNPSANRYSLRSMPTQCRCCHRCRPCHGQHDLMQGGREMKRTHQSTVAEALHLVIPHTSLQSHASTLTSPSIILLRRLGR